jgi:hypothetical protein
MAMNDNNMSFTRGGFTDRALLRGQLLLSLQSSRFREIYLKVPKRF